MADENFITENDSKESVKKVKKPRKPMSDERKAQLREQLKKGRETALANRQKKAKLKKIEKEEKSKDEDKKIAEFYSKKAGIKNETNDNKLEEIVKLAKKYKIDVIFFHGRGGSAGRGGGPIQATLRSLPPNSVNGKIRITDQGEVIQQKYGFEPLAKYNLCSYIGAVSQATLLPPPEPKSNWRSLIEKMADISKSSYRKNINQNSDFIKYFKTVTPHVSLGKLSIGSRPSKRKNVDNIQSLRAIPWIFAWTQIRLMLPAWLGSAEALRYANIKEFKKTLYDMERNWPFFNSMLDMLSIYTE